MLEIVAGARDEPEIFQNMIFPDVSDAHDLPFRIGHGLPKDLFEQENSPGAVKQSPVLHRSFQSLGLVEEVMVCLILFRLPSVLSSRILRMEMGFHAK